MIDTLQRRELLHGLMVLAGVAAIPANARALFTGPASLPAASRSLLVAVADTMIPATDTPGAVGAGVPEAFDKLMANWASPRQRDEILGALDDIDAKAGGFADLSAEKRLAMLDAHDRASSRPPVAARLEEEPDKGAAGSPGYAELKKTQEEAKAVTPDYARLKDLIVTLYYLSEIGATTELRYEHNPGAWEPSLPVTAETRNYGGPAGF